LSLVTNAVAIKSAPRTTIAAPATVLSTGWLSNRNAPRVVAASPGATKTAEKVATNRRLRASTRASTRRPTSCTPMPDTVAR
jgi:hypothetical protein